MIRLAAILAAGDQDRRLGRRDPREVGSWPLADMPMGPVDDRFWERNGPAALSTCPSWYEYVPQLSLYLPLLPQL